MFSRNSDESKKLLEEMRKAYKTMNAYDLHKYLKELYSKFDGNYKEYNWYERNAQLDIGTKVEFGGNYPDWSEVIKSITFKELDNEPAEYLYEVNYGYHEVGVGRYIGNDRDTIYFFADELTPIEMTNRERWEKMKNGTAKDKRLLDKVGEVINKFKFVDNYDDTVIQIFEYAIGSIAYSIKKYKFKYIVELAYELEQYYHYYRNCRYIPDDDCVPVARELMISIYGYEPPLEHEDSKVELR